MKYLEAGMVLASTQLQVAVTRLCRGVRACLPVTVCAWMCVGVRAAIDTQAFTTNSLAVSAEEFTWTSVLGKGARVRTHEPAPSHPPLVFLHPHSDRCLTAVKQ